MDMLEVEKAWELTNGSAVEQVLLGVAGEKNFISQAEFEKCFERLEVATDIRCDVSISRGCLQVGLHPQGYSRTGYRLFEKDIGDRLRWELNEPSLAIRIGRQMEHIVSALDTHSDVAHCLGEVVFGENRSLNGDLAEGQGRGSNRQSRQLGKSRNVHDHDPIYV